MTAMITVTAARSRLLGLSRSRWLDLPGIGAIPTLAWTGVLLVLALSWGYGSDRYIQGLIGLTAAFIVSAIGYNVVLGYAGQLAFGQSGFMALGAYCYAIMQNHGYPSVLAAVAALVLPAMVAAIVGIAALRVSHLYLALITLAFAQAIEVLVSVTPITGRSDGISIDVAGGNAWVVAVVSAFLVILLTDRIVRSRTGRAFSMVREDEEAAMTMGVPRTSTKVLAFVISGILGGGAGILLGGSLNYVTPQNFNVQVTLFVLTILVIGGLGSLIGTALGSALMVYVQYGLQVPPGYLNIMYGVILLAVIILNPGGIVRLPQRIRILVGKARPLGSR